MTKIAAVLAGILLTGSILFTGCTASTPPADEQKETHYLNGRARVISLDYKGAIQEFEKALEVNPRSASAHLELALLLEEQLQDYAAAIYHYEKHLQHRPDSEYAERARDRIKSCKMDLVKGEVLGPVTMGMQKELERLAHENGVLRQRAEALELQLSQQTSQIASLQQASLSQSHARIQPTRNPTPADQPTELTQPGSRTGRNPQPSPAPQPAARPTTNNASRQHVVKSGEKLTSIAARYGISLNRLQQANPSVDPRRLRVGQTLKIP